VDENEADDFGFQPVTGIFTHQSNDVWTLEFDSGDTLGVTSNHPIYSTTAQDWRLAGELALGEQVLTHAGSARLTGKRPAPAQTVYNLEVQEVHNFLVTGVGVVVHNSCGRNEKRYYGNVFESPLEHIERGHSRKNNINKPINQRKPYFNEDFDDTERINELLDELVSDTDDIWEFAAGSNQMRIEAMVDAASNSKYEKYLKDGAIGFKKDGTPVTKFYASVRQDGSEITIENLYPYIE